MTILTVLHVFTCVVLILVVLVQSGKGADISASLGGSSQTVFGSSGGANFFTRFTSGAAGIFMITSLALTILGGQENRRSVMEGIAPAVPAAQTTDASKSAPAKPAETAPAAKDAAKTDAAKAPAADAKAPEAAKPKAK